MIDYVLKNPFIVSLAISLFSVILEFYTTIGKFLSAYFFSFFCGIIMNIICELQTDNKIYDTGFFLKQTLSYSLCISIMLTFSFIKKKVKNIPFLYKSSSMYTTEFYKNIYNYKEIKNISIYNFINQSRLLHLGIAFFFGAISTIIGVVISYILIKHIFIKNKIDINSYYLKNIASCFVSTYIGGFINFIEVSDMLNLNTTLRNSIFILDDMFTNIFLMMLPICKNYTKYFYSYNDNSIFSINKKEEQQADQEENIKNKIYNSFILNYDADEEKKLINKKSLFTSYGSFTNHINIINNKERNYMESPYFFIYNMIHVIICDFFAIMFIFFLTRKILNDFEFLYKHISFYINIDKIKTPFLLIITFIYIFSIDYVLFIMNKVINNNHVIDFVMDIYYRSLEYYSTILKLTTIYYLSLSAISINIKNVFNIAKPLVLFIICILIIHVLCTFIFSYIYNCVSKSEHALIYIDDILLAINANIGGPTTAALMSEMIGRSDLIFASLFWGVVGYLIATPIAMQINSIL
ncbi:conserved Plasmodium membrane protein, unknown function [Plasmodium sp. gorilla clade G2]|uniref:conserved Plasmodium membrane protein, unknown function n=1 Tax=Plasmodium sp. gorilla clade G2 TaxID=880535 RepID=UPI000D2281AC|nr:conserved Plasmodium membrane protein, unknown function [Plasmodium sp. gorilla clade G2]SOV17910.1 conserved Plasmodium membrane protein, unknown function [Plasmodium sp. gorilla clade G2]